MHPALQEKINKLKEEVAKQEKQKIKEKNKAEMLREKQIKAKIPEAKVWVESTLLDLIAKEDIKIEQINKNKTEWVGDKRFPKELYLSKYNMIPNNIPVEAVVLAIKDFEGLKIRSSWVEESKDIDGPMYPACWEYYVQW